jgi:hypothetical protein
MGEAARRRADGEASGCDSELGVGLRGPAKGGGMLEGRRHASSSLLHRFMAPGWVRVQRKAKKKTKKSKFSLAESHIARFCSGERSRGGRPPPW